MSSQLPRYFLIEQSLLEQIHSNALRPGDTLPSEAKLAEMFGVSRITAKRALDDLVQQGFAYRHQGRGTFVARGRIKDISGYRSFSEEIRAQGREPRSEVLSFREEFPSREILDRLHLEQGSRVYLLKRVRLADGEPVAVESAYLPSRICPALGKEDMAKESLYQVLQRRYNIVPVWADSEIEAREATREESRLLKLKTKGIVLAARRITYSMNHDVIESVDSVYRADRFTFHTGRQRIG
ncbi:MAG: GntR family transcriptional regulator [Firmicutes bacterium]|nr:GntR family transcriptional regulator [Bacillota bacterium]